MEPSDYPQPLTLAEAEILANTASIKQINPQYKIYNGEFSGYEIVDEVNHKFVKRLGYKYKTLDQAITWVNENLPHATVPSLLDKKGFSPKYWVAMFPGDTDVIIKTAHKCLMDSQALAQELFDEDKYEQLLFITVEVSAVNAV